MERNTLGDVITQAFENTEEITYEITNIVRITQLKSTLKIWGVY